MFHVQLSPSATTCRSAAEEHFDAIVVEDAGELVSMLAATFTWALILERLAKLPAEEGLTIV